MKRLGALAFLFCAYFVSTVWAQTSAPLPRFGKHAFPPHGIYNKITRTPAVAAMPNFGVQGTYSENMKVWDLGTYPGGFGSWVGDINDFAVAVGWGVMSDWNQQHPMMVPLFGPHAMQWVDLGTLGSDGGEALGVSDTGIIVGHSYTSGGNDRAFVWTSKTGMVDLGTLPNLGHTESQAQDVNRIGTLIVGYSANPDSSDMRPVVWTPSFKWTKHGLVTTWTIHQLDASALGPYTNGMAMAVSNFGQIAGGVWNDSGDATVLWRPSGRRWKPTQLYGTAEYPNPFPAELNDRGEVVGTLYAPDWFHGCAGLWQPAGPKKTYKLTQLPDPWGLCNGDGAIGINNQGDIVGAVYPDEGGNSLGAYWTTKDPTHVLLMPVLPNQTWSYLANLNEFGIAAGGYGGIDFMHGVAVQVH